MYVLWRADARRALQQLAPGQLRCVITSPPYWGLRRYGAPPLRWADGWCGELGAEDDPRQYVAHLREVLRAVHRALHPNGTLWLNLGDTYAGGGRGPQGRTARVAHTARQGWAGDAPAGPRWAVRAGLLRRKSLAGIPERVVLALLEDGWCLRARVVWAKRSPLPQRAADRPWASWEPLYLFTKSPRYYFDRAALRALGAERDVWTLGPERAPRGTHSATFPLALAERAILASTRPREWVCDPFCGSGTVVVAALRHGRRGLGVELVEAYWRAARARLRAAEHDGEGGWDGVHVRRGGRRGQAALGGDAASPAPRQAARDGGTAEGTEWTRRGTG